MTGKEWYKEQLKTSRWLETRARIVLESYGTCQNCKEPTDTFEVHHLEHHGNHPSDTPDELLIALCPSCHYHYHWLDRLEKYHEKKNELIMAGANYDEINNLVEVFNV